MYEGSMVGAGAIPFAIMGYVIANFQPDKTVGAQVRLNPVLLATILGESQEDIEKGIAYLCAPDKNTTTPGDEGRRLVKIGQFDYKVVNGAKYHAIRNQDERRESNRLAKQRERASRKLNGESQYERNVQSHGQAEADRMEQVKGELGDEDCSL